MKAHVFYLAESQEDLCELITDSLRKEIYPSIQIDFCKIRRGVGLLDKGDSGRWAQAYLTFLKTSLLFDKDFSVRVTGHDSYSYLGGYSDSPNFLELNQDDLTSLFPAVGIMGRLVLAPEALLSSKIIAHPREFLWCPKPLDIGGLTLSDFIDEASIQKAIRDVSNRILVEIRKVVAAYKHKQNVPSPNLKEVAKLLDISERYISSNKAFLIFQSTSVSISVQSPACIVERSSKVRLQLHNETEYDFEWVRIKIRGPATSLPRPIRTTVKLPSLGTSIVEFYITASVAPFCPIEVAFELSNTKEGAQPFPSVVILDVVP